VEFVGIALLDSKEASRGFVQKHRLTFPNGYDGNGSIAKAYGFIYQPYWATITKDGMLVKASRGPSSEEELVAAVKSLTGR